MVCPPACLVHARTPRPGAERRRGELKRIVENADFPEQIGRQAIEARILAPGEWPAFVRAELDKWGKVVRAVGIKSD